MTRSWIPTLLMLLACFACSDDAVVRPVAPKRDRAATSRGNAAVPPGESFSDRDSGAAEPGSDAAAPDAATDAGGLVTPAAPDTNCTPGATRCVEAEARVEICIADGRWVEKEVCASVCSDGKCTGDCAVGQRRCDDEGRPQSCDRRGQWVAETACEFVCSGEGQCGGECTPGQHRCGGSDELTPESCDERGAWVGQGPACQFICDGGSCSGTCEPGARRCGDNGVPEECSKTGSWERQPACPFVCSGAGDCTGECRPGTADCVLNSPRLCDAQGHFQQLGPCSGQACVGGQCVGECEPGERTCRGDMLGTCDGTGRYRDQACPAHCSEDRCVECLTDGDCAENALCQGNSCVAIACFGPPINGQGTSGACCDSRCGVAGFEVPTAEDPDGYTPASKGCGQPNCGHSRAGADSCCTGTIRMSGRSCKDKRSAPCWLTR